MSDGNSQGYKNYNPTLEKVQEWAKEFSYEGELKVNEKGKVVVNDYVIWDYKEFLVAIT